MIIRMEHCRQMRYCSAGVRAFFKRYKMDYVAFLKNGMDAQEMLRKTNNNALVTALMERCRGR